LLFFFKYKYIYSLESTFNSITKIILRTYTEIIEYEQVIRGKIMDHKLKISQINLRIAKKKIFIVITIVIVNIVYWTIN
jgi:hypothetical protein